MLLENMVSTATVKTRPVRNPASSHWQEEPGQGMAGEKPDRGRWTWRPTNGQRMPAGEGFSTQGSGEIQ